MAGSFLMSLTATEASTIKKARVTFGQDSYTSPGTYSWVAPEGVKSVSVVCVGGGGGQYTIDYRTSRGGAGGGLGYRNRISVVSGQSYTVVVGSGADADNPGGNSYFIGTSIVAGFGGGVGANLTIGGSYTGDGGGAGGNGGFWSGPVNSINRGTGGGGGGGGYTGNGGHGGAGGGSYTSGYSGTGGGGGGGAGYTYYGGGGGGGVGILGEGVSGGGGGYAGTTALGGGGGSGGSNGTGGANNGSAGSGGLYGGGAGGKGYNSGSPTTGTGGGGAVRIIYPGFAREFPSTNTAD